MTESIAIEDIVPHARPMLLLDRLLESGDGYIVCEVVVRCDGLFDTSGHVSSMLGLEYMAQAVSAYSGLQTRGMPIKMGFLLGTRRFETNVGSFSCGEILTVKVNLIFHDSDGIAAFECSVRGSNILQTARLTVYEPSDPESYMESISKL